MKVNEIKIKNDSHANWDNARVTVYIKQEPRIDDNGIWMPVEEYALYGTSSYRLAISKEMFVEAYNKWINEKTAHSGQWVRPFINKYGHPCHCCSECGFEASQKDKNYCPCCGTKMDLE